MKTSVCLHFGELLQFTCQTGNIVISNVLDSSYSLRDFFIENSQPADCPFSLYLSSLPSAVSSINCQLKKVSSSSTEAIDNSGLLVRRTLSILKELYPNEHDYTFNSTSRFFHGKGMGSSTADIIAASKLFFILNNIPSYQLDLRQILSLSEAASDPLYLDSPVLYNSVARSVLKVLPPKPKYLILGYDPFSGNKLIKTDSIMHPCNGSKLYPLFDELMGLKSSYHIDLAYAHLASSSLTLNNHYIDHMIPKVFFDLSNIPGIGITGSHSGVMIGLLITPASIKSFQNISSSSVELLSSLDLSIYFT